jgi:cyclophilin family peptidyl-prolyl cis-trans isomerase
VTVAAAVAIAGCGSGDADGDAESAEGGPELPPDMPDMTPTVVMETTMGRIVLELDRPAAPQTVENVVQHVEGGFYDGLVFHRVIPGFMIQGGGFTPEMAQRRTSRPALENEADNGLKNVRGSVAMARTGDPHSATTQFFINLADNPRLDHTAKTPQGWGYAVFGRVVEGMDVVDEIARVPTASRGPYDDVPVEPVVISRAYITEQPPASE